MRWASAARRLSPFGQCRHKVNGLDLATLCDPYETRLGSIALLASHLTHHEGADRPLLNLSGRMAHAQVTLRLARE